MTLSAELSAFGKIVPRSFTVLDIGSQKMQGVRVDNMFLQHLTVPDDPNDERRTEGILIFFAPQPGACRAPSLIATVNRSFVNGMT
jgi:hypothetical protein